MITRRGVLICGSAAALVTFIRMPAQTFKPAKEPHMDIDIKRIGSRPSQKGPEDWFTGTVRLTRCSNRRSLHARAQRKLRSNPAQALRSTRTRSGSH
jgi:hypothetical protein